MDNDRMIRLTPDNGESNTAPASYWLNNWRNHARAQAAIRSAMRGLRSSFETPRGMMIVSPA